MADGDAPFLSDPYALKQGDHQGDPEQKQDCEAPMNKPNRKNKAQTPTDGLNPTCHQQWHNAAEPTNGETDDQSQGAVRLEIHCSLKRSNR